MRALTSGLTKRFRDQAGRRTLLGMRTLVASIATAAALALAPIAPASADDTPIPPNPEDLKPVLTVTTDDGILYSGCRDHDYSYSATKVKGYDWTARFQLIDPDGVVVTERSVRNGPNPSTGWFEICDDMPAGDYTVSMMIERETEFGFVVASDPQATTFTMRYPVTETVVTKLRGKAGVQGLKVKSLQERPGGLRPAKGATIAVQRKVGGKWVAVRGGRMKADKSGVAVLNVKLATKKPVKLRARTLGGDEVYTSSTSRTVTLR